MLMPKTSKLLGSNIVHFNQTVNNRCRHSLNLFTLLKYSILPQFQVLFFLGEAAHIDDQIQSVSVSCSGFLFFNSIDVGFV